MGVINLGLLVDKIKRKLENSGFIKNTDYATASAAGVVKIGDNIDVTEDGVISVPFPASGGFTVDKLFDGTVTKGVTTDQTLAHPYTDYKALCVVRVSGSNSIPGAVMIVDTIQTGASNNNNTGNDSVGALRFNEEDATKFHIPQGSGTIDFRIYGFK